MGHIKLYRRFYCMVPTVSGDTVNQVYTLINPNELSAKVYIYNTSNLVETIGKVVRESTGIYYVNLNPKLYSFDNTYDLVWSVNYTEIAPLKNLKTTFRIQPIIIGSDIEVEHTQNVYDFEIEQQEIEIEIENNISTELDSEISSEIDNNNIQIEIINP